MPWYDGIGTPEQVGNNLDIHTGHAYPDAHGTNNGTQTPLPYATICIHQDEIYAAWTEADLDTGIYYGRGPYVKKWNGSSWISVGGEVDPNVTPWDVSDVTDDMRNPPFGNGRINAPAGTYFVPARAKIGSDGNDLYICYSIHFSEQAPNQPTGQLWAPRRTYVRKWNGTDWELFGEIAAQGLNNGKFTAVFSGSSESFHYQMQFAISPAEPGVCYVGVLDAGVRGFDSSDPYIYEFSVTKFDGSDTIGEKKVIGSRSVVSYTNRFHLNTSTGSSASQNYAFWINNETGIPWVIWRGWLTTGTPTSPQTKMQNWNDLSYAHSDLRNGVDFPISDDDWAGNFIGYGEYPETNGLFYSSYVRQVPSDGSGDIEFLDDNPVEILPRYAGSFSSSTNPNLWKSISEGEENIFAVENQSGQDQRMGTIWIYHRPCRAWTRFPKVTEPFAHWNGGSSPIPYYFLSGLIDTVLYDNEIWQVGPTIDILDSNPATTHHFQVWKQPIIRDYASCEMAFPTAIHLDEVYNRGYEDGGI